MYGGTADLDSESLDSDTDLNMGVEGDSDLEGIERELGRPTVNMGGGLVIGGGGGHAGSVGVGGGKVKGSRMRGPVAAAVMPQQDDDDFWK